MKIAMWSGPRNLSTAMMYSFGNRQNMTVFDEPFYAAYLDQTGLDHPMRTEVLGSGQSDPIRVTASLTSQKGDTFLKLMAFHMLDGFPMDWAGSYTHFHLIRHPARVVSSYSNKRHQPDIRDIGFQQQVEAFERFPGPVVSSTAIRNDPQTTLAKLCDAIGLKFERSMLAWKAGPKPFDGCWAPHWYDQAHKSTGFAGAEGPLPELSEEQSELVLKALPYYEEMEKHHI